ncbi:MAG: PLP-dependent aspartate aminotransferase family protein [Candidatus Thermoplasmatota archaeon]|nr:PLP-dependent aspartate aminotransferase family protein [Candidatus Thermoplasmatota archaeon]
MKFSTRSIHVGEEPDTINGVGDVVSSIHLSTTFARKEPGKPTKGYEYTRSGNPTRIALENKIASLENARHGLMFSSGLAAETTLFLSLLKTGDHIIASDDLYGGTERLLRTVLSGLGITYELRDLTKTFPLESVPDNTRMIYLETPSNPLLRIVDIEETSKNAKKLGIIVAVDNTFATPYFQNPLQLGADVVVHSTTKYINGHSDSLGGALITNTPDILDKLKFNQNAMGAVMSPFDSYLTMRGIKTLAVRMKEHERNASEIVSYLKDSRKVRKLYYPGLAEHENHDIARKQMRGYGGMLSFRLDTDNEGVKRFVGSLKYISLAESLGGVESLIEIPSLMTHSGIPREIRERHGISDDLIRLSVGIEDGDDLIEDVSIALEKV